MWGGGEQGGEEASRGEKREGREERGGTEHKRGTGTEKSGVAAGKSTGGHRRASLSDKYRVWPPNRL